MRVTLTRRNRQLAAGTVVDARGGSLWIVLDGRSGRFRFDRIPKRDGVYYRAAAPSLQSWGKVKLLPEESDVRERAERDRDPTPPSPL